MALKRRFTAKKLRVEKPRGLKRLKSGLKRPRLPANRLLSFGDTCGEPRGREELHRASFARLVPSPKVSWSSRRSETEGGEACGQEKDHPQGGSVHNLLGFLAAQVETEGAAFNNSVFLPATARKSDF